MSKQLNARRAGIGHGAMCVVLLGAFVVAQMTPGSAQQPPSASSPARPTGTKAAAPKTAPKVETPAAAPAANEATLKTRIEQLEEQLVEMQVTIGTLDSLAKGGSSSSGVYRGSGGDAAAGGEPGRVAALETQVRALATQVEQLSQQVRSMNATRSQAQLASPPSSPPANSQAQPVTAVDTSDPIGRLVSSGAARPAPVAAGTIQPTQPDAASSIPQAAASDASAKQAYETAYGHLLQQDFASAEVAFDEFLKRFPSDPLAGNAQYWLGESYFARGQFKPAAAAFLKGYQTYGRSAKAPDSVLKLAMSLDKLGQKDAACASYAELNSKFPNAPAHVKNRADTERRRLACG